ncbi:unnamed protein product [Bemisia tabaci]|uniref:Prokaryotic-type class I peptide chain release factors domain-containing protein n=1 Tax=Bemisia tabaci TaxID=7038 RepID=A0A9P0CBB0_BEMTA|nr:unnamed protein product [Bemisia tabaci]
MRKVLLSYKTSESSDITSLMMFPIYQKALIRNSVLKQFFPSCVASILKVTYKIDRSKVPTFDEKDIKEQFVRGSGPGGQSVARSANQVILTHLPTGFIIRCHETRSVEQNRKIAREKLITKLDNEINGENSVEAQQKRIDKKRASAAESKRRKLEELKRQWKEREGLT